MSYTLSIATRETRDLVVESLRAAAGQHTDTVTVTLRDGTKAVALINIDLVPDPTQEP